MGTSTSSHTSSRRKDKMSQNQAPFVVATSNPPHNISPTVGHSPVTSPAANRSAIIITAHIDSHKQQGTSPAVASGHRRAGSDATHRRQQFAESPQSSVHDQVYSVGSHTSPVRADISSAKTPSKSSPAAAENSLSAASTNGHSPSSVSSRAGEQGDSITNLSSPDSSPLELEGVELRRKQRPLRQAQSEVPLSMTSEQRRCSQSLTDAKELAYARLMAELSKAHRELRLRDEECEKLSKLRAQMEHEIDELTASLFTEANNMVQEANIKRMNAEKRLEDANHKVEILQGEVAALKDLVMTSTPSTPNKHLHPQICQISPKKEKSSLGHRRSTSHHEFTKEARAQAEELQQTTSKVKESSSYCGSSQEPFLDLQMDTLCFDEFQRWKLEPSVTDITCPFLSRIFMEDIQPCLNFHNKKLAERVQQCVQQNTLTIEPIPGDNSFPRKCSLSDMHKLCNYKIKLEENDEWHSISQMCRNRIAAVCDFYTYIRYIAQGLVKSADKDMFYEIVRLRLQMATARLGC